MRPNPWTDIADFLTAPTLFNTLFLLLLLASLTAAIVTWRNEQRQHSAYHLGMWLLRVLVGSMWWQQSLWKVPPDYDGLIHWMQEMVDHASVPLQSRLVAQYVIPDIHVFGPIVYATEVFIGVSLILGLVTRLGALAGLGMALNLWLGLYSAPGEWPWTYVFLIVIQAIYVLDPPGRSLGLDAWMHRRLAFS